MLGLWSRVIFDSFLPIPISFIGFKTLLIKALPGNLPAPVSDALAGQTWVISGALDSMTRDEAGERLRQLGAKVAGSVSKKTTCLVAGPRGG